MRRTKSPIVCRRDGRTLDESQTGHRIAEPALISSHSWHVVYSARSKPGEDFIPSAKPVTSPHQRRVLALLASGQASCLPGSVALWCAEKCDRMLRNAKVFSLTSARRRRYGRTRRPDGAVTAAAPHCEPPEAGTAPRVNVEPERHRRQPAAPVPRPGPRPPAPSKCIPATRGPGETPRREPRRARRYMEIQPGG